MSVFDRAESSTEPRIGRSVSLEHAAALMGVSRPTIYNRIRTVGGSQRVLLESFHPRYLVPQVSSVSGSVDPR